jgi:hypothetical protein
LEGQGFECGERKYQKSETFLMASGGSTVVEHLSHHSKVQGSSPVDAPGAGEKQMFLKCLNVAQW